MNASRLTFQVNDLIQLELIPEQTRYTVRLLGYLVDKSLIVGAPLRNGRTIAIREGQNFAARTMVGSEAVGFRTKLLQQRVSPFPYMHLAYPKEVETKQVRNARRVQANQNVTVSVTQANGKIKTFPALLSDLSQTGARLSGEECFAEETNSLQISFNLEVAKIKHKINIQGLVRNHRELDSSENLLRNHEFGIQFQNMDDQTRLLLSAFVNERLVEDFFD